MTNHRRHSPITFAGYSVPTKRNDGWEVAIDDENGAEGTFLIDLSHIGKWDVQGENLSSMQPIGIPMPKPPGQCAFENGSLINRLKWNWATIWCLNGNRPESFQEYAYTDVTEAYALLGLAGENVFSIMEKITALDLLSTDKKPPFVLQGPIVGVRSQVVVPESADNRSTVLIACARGYGQSLADALLDAGREWGLQPAGEKALKRIVNTKI